MKKYIVRHIVPLFLLAGLLGCDDFTFFFAFNTGPIDPNGLVVVIGVAQDPPPTSVTVIEGTIPRGMELMADGTVQGVPEEHGIFDFTLEFTREDGSTDTQPFHVELEE